MKATKLACLVLVLFCSSLKRTNAQCNINAAWTDSIYQNGNVQFYAADTVTAGTYHSWNFGDGAGGSHIPNPTHQYLSSGKYHVCQYIYITNGTTCVDSSCETIEVHVPGCSGFNVKISDILQPQPPGHTLIALAGGDSIQGNSYKWSNGQTTGSISVKTAGVYCVTVTNTAIGCSASACDSVHIKDTCAAYFTYQLGQAAGNVQFTNYSTSTDSIISYAWYFGDNTPSSSDKSPSHIFSSGGVYYTCLRMQTVGGCVSYYCDSVHVTVSTSCSGVTANWTTSINGATVQFLCGDTANGPTHHDWSFGDGSPEGFGSNPSHTYHQSGTYHVCQYVYVETGNAVVCSDSFCSNVTVTVTNNCAGLNSDWTYSGNTTNGTIQFNATDTATVTTHHYWNFGDGSPYGTGANPTHTYTTSGTYHICQYAYIVGTNCSDSSCGNIKITIPSNCTGVTAAWSNSNLTNGNVHFTSVDTASGTTHHIWNFGDNTSSYDVNPTHAYANSGTYHVCQYVYIVGTTCVDSFCNTIQAGAGNNCSNFHAQISVSSDSPNLGYKLTAQISGGASPYTYKWSPSNSATGGSYIIVTTSGQYCVTVSDANGCTTSACDTVHISGGNPCNGLTAAWSDTLLTNGNVHFVPADLATNVIHAWSFGDGTTSGNLDPVHTYSASGRYHVCLYVYIAGSTCVDSSCADIQVQGGTSCAGLGVSIKDVPDSAGNIHILTAVPTSANISATYNWSTSQTNNPIYVYRTGNYCVKATFTNGCYAYACDSVVIGVNTNPCSGISASWTPTYAQNGGVQFNGVASPVPVTNVWVFGDGTYSTSADPTHYYAQSGLYTVCHFVYTANYACIDSACRAIQATGSDNCHASFTYLTSSTGGNGKLYFKSTSTSNDSIVSSSWSFGDGQTGTGSLTYHVYANSGTYYACLTITTANGCTNTHCDSVTVGGNSPCKGSFTWHANNCLTVAFQNTSPPGYTLQRWIYGDGTSDTVSNPIHTYTQSGTYTVILHDYYTNCYSFDTMVVTLPSCANNDTICGVVFEDLNNDGIMDNGETGIIGVTVHVGGVSTTTDSSGFYQVILPAGHHYVYIYTPAGCIPTLPLAPDSGTNAGGYNGYYITGSNSGTYCGYNFGVDCNVVHICGTVYFDANNNGIQDSTEAGIANVHVVITDSAGHKHNAYTNNNGQYCETLLPGNYTITIIDPYSTGSVTPASISVNATGAGQNYGNNNFGIYVQPGACDLSISLKAHSTVTAGFPAWYSIEVCNVGAVSSSGTVSMFYDPSLTFNYSYPKQSGYNASTETLTWNVNSLDPGTCAYFWVAFKADVPLTLGAPVFTLADINPGTGCNDVNFNNNVDTVQQVVTGSWDPNSLVVSPIGVGTPGYISSSQELTYTINFQNTGTAPAVNIVVQDTIPGYLNAETFRMVGASHSYTMQQEGNVVVWKFSNIMLPDSSVNEQASHGYVAFAVTPNPGLAQATQIFNAGNIYFDYNQGVGTNTTLNTIDVTLAINNLTGINATITLQPNPFKDYTTIRITGADAPYELKVYDLLGNLVNNVVAEQNIFNVDRGTMAAGMYLYEIYQKDKIIGKGKMVAQ